MQIADGLRNLIEKVRGKVKIIGVYNEHVSTMYPDQFRGMLYNFLELDQNIPKQIEGVEEERAGYDPLEKATHSSRWITERTVDEILKLQSVGTCAKWIEEFGFNAVHDASEMASFSLLTVEEMATTKNPYPIPQRFMPKSVGGREIDQSFRPSVGTRKPEELDVAMGLALEKDIVPLEILNMDSPVAVGNDRWGTICLIALMLLAAAIVQWWKRSSTTKKCRLAFTRWLRRHGVRGRYDE